MESNMAGAAGSAADVHRPRDALERPTLRSGLPGLGGPDPSRRADERPGRRRAGLHQRKRRFLGVIDWRNLPAPAGSPLLTVAVGKGSRMWVWPHCLTLPWRPR